MPESKDLGINTERQIVKDYLYLPKEFTSDPVAYKFLAKKYNVSIQYVRDLINCVPTIKLDMRIVNSPRKWGVKKASN